MVKFVTHVGGKFRYGLLEKSLISAQKLWTDLSCHDEGAQTHQVHALVLSLPYI